MAFPGTYNIDYYKGDTFEFRVYPKDSNGNQFQINQYTQFRFTISDGLGSEAVNTYDAYAAISDDKTYILCAIPPEVGNQLLSGTTYHYDVEIGRISSPYDYIYTILQGTINVSEQVTLPSAVPNSPQNVTLTFSSSIAGTVSWDPPSGTAPVSYYKVYLTSPFTFQLNTTPIVSSATDFYMEIPAEYQAYLPPGTPITIGVTAENISGESTPAYVSGIIQSGS